MVKRPSEEGKLYPKTALEAKKKRPLSPPYFVEERPSERNSLGK
jgi:hypothetical protein